MTLFLFISLTFVLQTSSFWGMKVVGPGGLMS